MWQTTSLTKILDLQYPIIQAPMAGGSTTPELVAAVSNAGGLGSLGAGYMRPIDIREAINKIREHTDKPFAVNLFIPERHHATVEQMQKACDCINQSCTELNIDIEPVEKPYGQSFQEQIEIVIEEQIPVFSFTFGVLDSALIAALKKNNTILIGTATTLAEALTLDASGVDMIVAQGSEAGGHRGTFIGAAEQALINLSSLVPQLAAKIKLPIIAAGGIMNGRGIITSLALGAAGVQMGTAFLSCFESGADAKYKQILVNQQQDKTTLTRAFSGKLARGIKNKFINRMDSEAVTILDYPIQNALTRSMRNKARELGDADFMSLWAGQAAHLCKNISANELIRQIVAEANELDSRR